MVRAASSSALLFCSFLGCFVVVRMHVCPSDGFAVVHVPLAGTIAKHLAEHIISIHVGYDPSLKHCWPQIYDAVCAMEPNSDYGRKTLTTSGAIGEWFDNHRWEVLNTPICK